MQSLRFSWFILVLLLSTPLQAAQFTVGKHGFGLLISGPIQRGDYAKLGTYALSTKGRNALLNAVFLDSPGGDVGEALKIANLLDQSFANTFVDKDAVCASSCFLIWAAGSIRNLSGRLGVHRITLSSSDVDVNKTDKVVRPASQSVESFLIRMGMPRKILDKMNETSSSDIFIVDNRWLFNEDIWSAVQYRPTFIDTATKKCGNDPHTAGIRSNILVDREIALKWMTCVDGVRSDNQQIHLKEIVSLIIDASGWK